MQQSFIILGGMPGSGKSTISRELKQQRGCFVVSTDTIRFALNAGTYPLASNGDYALLDPIVWKLAGSAVTDLLRGGQSVAIDATNVSRARRQFWLELAREAVPGIHVGIVWCEGSFDSPERWQSTYGYSRKEHRKVIVELQAMLERPTEDEADELHFYKPPQRTDAAEVVARIR